MTDPKNESEDFAALLAEYDEPGAGRGPSVGDVVRGQVVSVGKESVFVDLGGKAEGVLERTQVQDADGELIVEVGSEVEARVVSTRGGTVILRRHVAKAKGAEAAGELLSAFEHQMPVEGLVTGVNKGGVEVQIAGVRAFCPISQLDMRFVEDPDSHVGQRYLFRITKLEPGRGSSINMVVSRRRLLEEEAAQKADELRTTLGVGAVVRGTVTTLKPYGAFVDLGGLEGMIHISEVGFRRVEDPSEVVSQGQTVEVQIVKIEDGDNPSRPKIGLSLKALESDPWETVSQRFAEGSKVNGTIVRLQPFGAFVELAPGLEGLVHISEIGAGRRINHPREVVREGQEVEVTVLRVESDKKRIALTMRDPSEREDAPSEEVSSYVPDAPEGKGLGTLGDLLAKVRDKK